MTYTPPDVQDSPSTATPLSAANIEAWLQTAGDYSDTITANTQTGNYTLVLADRGKVVEMNAAGATTVTVPPNSSEAFPIGAIVEVHRYGAGTVTLVAGAGVTLRSPGGLLAVASQYDTVAIRKRATNEWVVSGNLA